MSNLKKYLLPGTILLIAAAFLSAMISVNWSLNDLFITPDQRGRLLMAKKEFGKAAEVFQDPMQRGTALYLNGDFKAAASAFSQADTVVALYNRGNALLMTGKYDAAISAYQEALKQRPEWPAARDNLALARIRKEKIKAPDDDAGGTKGKLEADEFVFDNRAKSAADDQQEQIAGGEQFSDQAMRALWLRRVETKPADFLRAKFAYQKAFANVNETPEKSEGRN